jgi:hypothetical protein
MPKTNRPVRELMLLTLKLHEEIDLGMGDEAQADAIRDDMDDLWKLIPRDAKDAISNMSGALNDERKRLGGKG